MDKFSGLLICSDLDGTLLDEKKQISKENLDAIEHFTKNGGLFTYMTGRIPLGLIPVLKQYTPKIPLGCINGAGLFDIEKNKMVWCCHVDKKIFEMVDFVYKAFPGAGIELTCENEIYFARHSDFTRKHQSDEKLPERLCDYKNFDLPMVKVLIADDMDNIEKIKDALGEHPLRDEFSFIRSDKWYYEILPRGVSKGNVLLKLAELMGISRKNTIAIGDNENDVSMIEEAGIGIAVKNAYPKLKENAQYITVSNKEHAIARVIDDIEKGKIEILESF